ncbi:glycoside hydrolase family 36 protein [Actinocrispum wychmicini]|uniref:Alpha-galactosidase n=1 Tax=Actinocrispum wychmicini TaxID=1213861 RepID=A0A4R2JF49_9PSEU|nr:glycoside hydrolase family 36 protein [Actinocrispum wychmicini]TCO58351.1 alpha-galactosidase [Actinocrispum wychmicini]
MRPVTEIPIDPSRALVHEQGWQSWSPSTSYSPGTLPYRPANDIRRIGAWRAESLPAPDVYRGEGLVVVDPGDGGPVHVIASADPTASVPAIDVSIVDSRAVVSASGEVTDRTDAGPGGVQGALARWADDVAAGLGLAAPRPAPTIWCSWYQYFTKVTESNVDDNLALMDSLPIDVVQVDDGYQVEIGDWLVPSPDFADVPGLFARIRDSDHRAGIWTAPFLVGARSAVAADHPEWLVRNYDGSPVSAGHNWNQDLYTLDTTHPDAAEYLAGVYRTFRDWGIDFHKIDFVYAGALFGRRYAEVDPITAYREALALIRDAIGPDAYLLGCGAPQLPSIGLVDAMRVSPDIAPAYMPADGDISMPGQWGATLNGISRAFQHGRFWINDPDCLVARPDVERREHWAAHVSQFGGLRGSSDGLDQLDEWGLETTRRLLSEQVPRYFVES